MAKPDFFVRLLPRCDEKPHCIAAKLVPILYYSVLVKRLYRFCYRLYRTRYTDLARDVVSRLSRDLSLPDRDLETLLARLKSEGITFLTETLPLLAKALERGISTGYFECPHNFATVNTKSSLPRFLGGYFRKVFSLDGVYNPSKDSVYAVYVIRQLCYYFYKVELPQHANKDTAVARTFVSNEEYLAGLKISEDSVLLKASLLASMVFRDYSSQDLICKHGPGVTADIPRNFKFEAALPDSSAVRYLPLAHFANGSDFWNRIGRTPFTRSFEPQLVELLRSRSPLDKTSKILVGVSTTLNRSMFDLRGPEEQFASVKLVPKDSRGPRLISAEPFANQYLQQGIRKYLETSIEASDLAGGRINFRDQSVNQSLAREASLTHKWATLDLKDASDLIHMDLVRLIFRRCPELLLGIESARTPGTVLPSGEPHRLVKHAPMGSALCFPVMSFILWAVITSYLCERGLALKEAAASVHVFGDDIIVPSEHATEIIGIIERYGLKVNTTKSFIASDFAESCGYDSYLGNDVTPCRLKKIDLLWNTKPVAENPRVLVALVAHANRLRKFGFASLSEFYFSLAERHLGPLPFGSETSPYMCKHVWGRDTMRLAEINYVLRKCLWRKEFDKTLFPLGHSLRAWTIRALSDDVPETTFGGHWVRSRGSLQRAGHWTDALFENPSPRFGVFDRAKEIALVNKRIDHYGLSPV